MARKSPKRQEETRDESKRQSKVLRQQPGEGQEPFPAAQAKGRSVCEALGHSLLWHETEVLSSGSHPLSLLGDQATERKVLWVELKAEA